jgi:hypothetical protein
MPFRNHFNSGGIGMLIKGKEAIGQKGLILFYKNPARKPPP